MNVVLLIQLLLLVLLFLLSAFFSSSEIAFFSLDPHQVDRIREKHPLSATRIASLLARPTALLSTILIGNTLINTVVVILGDRLLTDVFPHSGKWLSITVMTVGLVIVGEYVPKRIAMFWPEKMAHLYSPLMMGAVRSLKWLRIGLERITNSLAHIFAPRNVHITEAEFQTIVDVSEESGALGKNEHSMMQAIIQIQNLYASDAMTPRVDIIGVDLDDGLEGMVERVETAKVRYVVLYREKIDEIEGLLDVRKFLLDPNHSLEAATINPFYVPEQCTLDKLLAQFLSDNFRVAIVVDEYGGIAGLITRGDIIEEITGELHDEHKSPPVFEALTEDAWLLDANLNLDEVKRRTGLVMESEASDRLAGWFIEQTGHLPSTGEMVQGEGFKAMVRQMRKNRIVLILLELDQKESP